MSWRFRSEWPWVVALAGLNAATVMMACSDAKGPAPPSRSEVGQQHAVSPATPSVQRAAEPIEPFRTASDDAAVSGLVNRLGAQQPQLVSAALAALERSADLEQNARLENTGLRRRVLELTAHENPGVRGRALRLLANLARRSVPPWPPRGTGWGPLNGVAVRTSLREPAHVPVSLWEAALARAWAARADPHPYVRAEACEALARLGYIQAIHGLMQLVDDRQPSHYELEGFTLEDGRPGRLRHGIPGRALVSDSVLHAIQTLSAGQLRLEPVEPKQPVDGASTNAQRVRLWYTQHARDRVPLPSPSPVFPAATRYRRTAPSAVEMRAPRIEGRVKSVLDAEPRY